MISIEDAEYMLSDIYEEKYSKKELRKKWQSLGYIEKEKPDYMQQARDYEIDTEGALYYYQDSTEKKIKLFEKANEQQLQIIDKLYKKSMLNYWENKKIKVDEKYINWLSDKKLEGKASWDDYDNFIRLGLLKILEVNK